MAISTIVVILGLLIIWIGIISWKNIKKIKKIAENNKFEKWTQKFPKNKEICERMLKNLQNTHTQVKQSNNSKTNLYVISTDTVLISENEKSFTRIQTVAHECIHSIQSKKLQWFHFIFSIFWNTFYFIVLVVQILGKIENSNLVLVLLLLFSYVYYAVRSYLEMDAMLKAKEIAYEYMKRENKLSKEELEELVNTYEKLNQIGVKTASYNLFVRELVKLIIYCIILMAK